jgi:hypothetical protein
MIAVKLSGGLGNNLFQYVTVRSIAERCGYAFCYFPYHGFRYFLKRLRRRMARMLGRAVEDGHGASALKQVVQADISRYFTLEPRSGAVERFNRMKWCLVPEGRKMQAVQRTVVAADGYAFGDMDPAVFEVPDWSLLVGSYQSFAFFSEVRPAVLKWLRLRPPYRRLLEEIEAQLPLSPERRCCIHVRLGDYLVSDKGLAWGDRGWALPMEYYRHAVSLLPDDCFFIIVTDNPAKTREIFDFLQNVTILEGNPEPVDMFVFTRCRYNIVANSTFSQWGAWLNETPGKQVFAPKYNLGWSIGKWVPASMAAHPEDWTYIDVRRLLAASPGHRV